jgi:hypothetical protein
MSDPPGPDFIPDITPRSAALALPGPLPAFARAGAVVSTVPLICQNVALRGCPPPV